MPADLRTRAIVLRRTNYGESDRILNFLTPTGKIAALARGVRKEKSRLAGGIELFSVADIVVHQGRASLATLTSAKMLEFYQNLLVDLPRLELASTCLKRLDRAAEQIDSPEHFELLLQVLKNLNRGADLNLISAWFHLNLQRIAGEELNLICDVSGQPLSPEQSYFWDAPESALRPDPKGNISAREIKFARFLLTNRLAAATKIEGFAEILPRITPLLNS